jgi:acyl carrier protein
LIAPNPAIADSLERIFREILSVEIPFVDAELIDSGVLDSLALVELISAIEEEFAIQVPLDGFEIEYFRTAKKIALFVQRASSDGPPQPSAV